MENWPSDVPTQLVYRKGEKPLFAYLQEHARDIPDQTAYIFYGREITWSELDLYTDRFAGFLSAKGLKKGDKVMLFLQNCPQYLIAHYGAQKIGAIVVPANPMFKQMELEYEANDVGASVIVTSDDLYPIVESARDQTDIREVVVSNYRDLTASAPPFRLPQELEYEKQSYLQTHDMMEIIDKHPTDYPEPDINIDEDVCLIVYTSGTTGRPKGAMLTYKNALYKTACASEFYQLNSHDCLLGVMPICHIAGNVLGVGMPAYTGASVVLQTRFEPDIVLSAMDKYNCTAFYGVTPMLLGMMDHPQATSFNLSSLKLTLCTSFGITFTEEIAQRWNAYVGGGFAVEAGYGLSETHTCDVFMPKQSDKFGANGLPVFDSIIKIVDPETGKELPVGDQGEIIIKNAGVFKGYLNRPDKTAETLRDGWVYTGDIGRFDSEGYLYFIGRTKEMIKCSGYSVFPEDVEAMLLNHPAVHQPAVIGVPDPTRGESVKAFIVLNPQYKGKITPDEIISWARENMAAYKYPRQVVFKDELPATGTGKVLRRLLKDEE